MCGGRLAIEVAPAGQIMSALGVFNACSPGTVASFMSVSYYSGRN
jgi:TRAP-type mannitol/chloroaromatic compound transport system substrate-binding protein